MPAEVFNMYDTEIGPQPGPQTILLASSSIPEVFFGGALGAGKSYALALDFERQHQEYGGRVSGIVLRMSVPELDDLIKTFRRVLEPFGWEYKVGKKTFVHADGAECRMRHCETDEDVRKYWGHAYTWMGVDELGDMPERTFNSIMKLRTARLRSAQGVPIRFVATGNPCGAGHKYCKERYITPADPFTPFKNEKTGHAMIYIPGRMENNVLMLQNDPDYRTRLQDLGPQWYIDALTNGDWTKDPEGNMFHREWFNNTYDPSVLPNFEFIAASWDTAFKTTKESARSACTVWGATKNLIYLLYAYAEKIEFPQLVRKATDIHLAWNCNYTWVEDKASGQSLTPTLKSETRIPVRAIKVDGDKQRRAFACTPFYESGKILLPKSATWRNEYVDELCAFPAPTGYSDYVDSSSQGVTEINKILKRMDRFSNRANVIPIKGSVYNV